MSAEPGNASVSLLTFYLDDEHYGVQMCHVREIIAWTHITKVPKMPAYIKGVMNLRGNIIPVIDLRVRFALAPKEPNMLTSVIVVSISGIAVGLVVDRVSEALSVEAKNLLAPPKFNEKVNANYLSSMAQGDFGVVAILALEAILGHEKPELQG